MKKIRTLLLLVIGLGIFGVIFFWSKKDHVSHDQTGKDTLTVGMISSWAPFMVINGAGDYEGFDVDVAREIAQRLHYTLAIQDMGSLASCFIALDQQRVDMVMSGLDITEKRRQAFDMVYYTGKDVKEFCLVFWEQIPHDITSMDDLKKYSDEVIAVESGSAQERFIDSFDFITKKRMNSVMDIILDLRFGKSFATVLEPRIAQRLQRQNPELQLLFVTLPSSFQVCGCGIALNQWNTELSAAVTDVVNDLIADGTIQKLEQKWHLEE